MSESPTESNVHPKVFTTSTKTLRSGAAHGVQTTKLNLILQAHKPMELASATIKSFTTPDWNKSQLKALETFKHILSRWSLSTTSPHGIPTELDMLRLIACISSIFFFGSLKNVHFVWCSTGKFSTALPYMTRGTASFSKNHGTSTITMSRDYWKKFFPTDSKRREADMLGTLLHECVHAFIHTYSCSSSAKRCREESCKATFEEIAGLTDHGQAWMELAGSVEKVARSRLGIQFIDLHRADAVKREKEEKPLKEQNELMMALISKSMRALIGVLSEVEDISL